MPKEKNLKTPNKLSYESDGQMGKEKQQKHDKTTEDNLFFNSTQDSE
ncbi:hypothetical protein [Cytobacillus gottheilii]|nr:hypothetical protein [Cytobacillus gottheilii]